MTKPLLEARNLSKVYFSKQGLLAKHTEVKAVDAVSLTLHKGKTLGIVGESGSGKSTTGRLLLGLEQPSTGEIRFDGEKLPPQRTNAWRNLRKHMQLVYQDPLAALDRRLNIATQIEEPLLIHGTGDAQQRVHGTGDAQQRVHGIGDAQQRTARVKELMQAVGLMPHHAARFPHELSGGQRQRVVIARAIACNPELLVCDEAVSALDVSIQAQVVNLLRDLQEQQGIAMVFISHDLKVVRNISDRVAVMYLGRIVEEAPSDVIFQTPQHPYTQALVSSIPVPGTILSNRIILQGEPPNPAARPSGCAFHPRCRFASERCRVEIPQTLTSGPERTVACHLYDSDQQSQIFPNDTQPVAIAG